MAKRTAASIQADIAKGAFRPHTALSNMALAYYQSDARSFAKTIFPICPVSLSSDNYYIFDKEDLLRDNWQRKPAYGKVDPAVLSEHTETYACVVDQMIMGIDQIRQTDLNRRMGPRTADPKQQRTKTMAGQANIHQDAWFARQFFKKGVWGQEFTGVDSTTVTSGQFIKFSNANSDPVSFVDDKKTEMEETTGRMPNRLALGVNVFNALKTNRKVPFTDGGIGLIEGQMEATLSKGQTVGGIAPTEYDSDDNEIPGYTVTVPLASDLTEAERKSRKLTGCRYTARLAGAIHIVEIHGNLTF